MGIEANAKITLRGGSEALKQVQGVTRGTNAASKAAAASAKENQRWAAQAIKLSQQRIKNNVALQQSAVRAEQAQQRAIQKTAAEVDKQAKRASAAQQKAAADAEKQAERALAAQLRAIATIEKAREREAKKLDAFQQKEADRYARMAQASAAREIELAKQTAASKAKVGRDALRAAGGLVGTLAAGALAGGLAANSTARSVSGARDVKTRIADANAFRERLVLTTGSAGLSKDEREKVQGQVLAASTKTGSDAGNLLGVVEEGQAKFNSLKFFADNLKEIATVAKASGADTKDLATSLGYMRQAFGLTDKEALESAYLIKAAADKGSVEVKDFARDFAAGAGIFATNTGQRGLGGVRQLLGTAQAIGTGGFGSAESATRFERFSADLNDVGVQKGLAGIGVKGFKNASGQVDVGNLIQQLSTNGKFQNAGTRQGIFKETRSLQAVEALMSANQRVRAGKQGAIDFRTIAGVDAGAGREAVSKSFDAIQGEGFFKFQVENAKMFEHTTENLESFNADLLRVVKAGDALETSFGSLSVWASSIAAAGLTSAGAGIAGKLLKGSAGGAEGGGALAKAFPSVAKAGTAAATGIGGLLAAGATTVGAASGAALAGTIGAGLAVGGAVGYGANKLTSAVRDDGQDISDLIVSKLIDRARNSQLTSGGTRNADGTLVTALKEQTATLKQIDSGLRAGGQKPQQGPARGPR